VRLDVFQEEADGFRAVDIPISKEMLLPTA
jgi:hypothetical protein